MTGTIAHFIHESDGTLVARLRIYSIPNPGNECRFHGPVYYRVTRVVHVYDEGDDRVNIGLEQVK